MMISFGTWLSPQHTLEQDVCLPPSLPVSLLYGTTDWMYYGDILGRGDTARIGVAARLSKK